MPDLIRHPSKKVKRQRLKGKRQKAKGKSQKWTQEFRPVQQIPAFHGKNRYRDNARYFHSFDSSIAEWLNSSIAE